MALWVIATVLTAGPSILHFTIGLGVSPILSGSMVPAAQPGDVFVTLTTRAADLKVGDIIVAQAESTGVLYAHRIVAIDSINELLSLTTKGDANVSADADPVVVGLNQTVSRKVITLNWIGIPLVYLTTEQGRQASFSLVILANLIALALFVFRKKQVMLPLLMQEQHSQDLVDAQTRIKSQHDVIETHKNFLQVISSQEDFDNFSKALRNTDNSSPIKKDI